MYFINIFMKKKRKKEDFFSALALVYLVPVRCTSYFPNKTEKRINTIIDKEGAVLSLCSKAVVPLLFLFCVALWFILWGASCFKVFLCSLSTSFLLVLWSPCLGKRELDCVCLVHLIVCFACVGSCAFSLPLFVGGWLRFVIVALPGHFN